MNTCVIYATDGSNITQLVLKCKSPSFNICVRGAYVCLRKYMYVFERARAHTHTHTHTHTSHFISL